MVTINADLTEGQVERIKNFMTENGIKLFSEGLRFYLGRLEVKTLIAEPVGKS